MNEHVLIAFPHPDDESFAAGGLMAQSVAKGIPVTYACGTLGEMGRNMGNPFFANRETLPNVRKEELLAACNALGVTDVRMLGFRDKMLEFEDPDEVADKIGEIIAEVQPTLVVTFYPGYAIHPDHDAYGLAVVKAVAKLPKEKRPELYCKAITDDAEVILGPHDIEMDVSDQFDRKIAALKAHRSQTEIMLSQYDTNNPKEDNQLYGWLSREVFWDYGNKLS
ncbi:bacillithiol biosynthesis deacetylase BshB2 [Tuberibacillus sp. Marseille-P3662]|uniref:bacillithiol biosynthesis deacetylase BshB2 n=1 Tax=Tuberibacillus sp. Marseille-P3662 TaxID=1965358 RepID=UPI000A1CA292|nr:bacillithiol biosynthesis deacetylase BshB2 [Tuberibacillus sp. Marseille-P3662]